ncbi:hypothetical protein L3Q82_011351 [Scortum barcoo]|uniref:Uncharacterized protein n=1 Tax=Scortum barcoo TaxID=214431 RepID=A0ACB8WA57_9TELE|nr:hypothetical protein L3Q82_011351 [Scortum barcoo]
MPRITVRRHSPIRSPGLTEKSVPNLKHGQDAYNSGDLEEYRKSRYALQRAISSAKRQYREQSGKISSAEVMSASLPDELNTFYARFESTSPAVEVQKAQEDHCPPVIQGRRVQNSKTD